jgi:hypothetical protein
MTPDKQEALAAKYHAEAIQRYVNSIHAFLIGLGTVMLIADGDANRDDALKAMVDDEREKYLTVEKILDLRRANHDAVLRILAHPNYAEVTEQHRRFQQALLRPGPKDAA